MLEHAMQSHQASTRTRATSQLRCVVLGPIKAKARAKDGIHPIRLARAAGHWLLASKSQLIAAGGCSNKISTRRSSGPWSVTQVASLSNPLATAAR